MYMSWTFYDQHAESTFILLSATAILQIWIKSSFCPMVLEEVDFDASESGHGVKFTASGVNWTMCRLGKDDYSRSISNSFLP